MPWKILLVKTMELIQWRDKSHEKMQWETHWEFRTSKKAFLKLSRNLLNPYMKGCLANAHFTHGFG